MTKTASRDEREVWNDQIAEWQPTAGKTREGFRNGVAEKGLAACQQEGEA